MAILGISGGPHLAAEDPRQHPFIDGYWHDAAAVLVDGGEVICAYEEERLSRIKNTTSFPFRAVRACLSHAAARGAELDGVAIYFTEDYWDAFFNERMLWAPNARVHPARCHLSSLLSEACGEPIAESKLHFVRHHETHAMSTWSGSGFDDALVLVLDGAGETESGTVWQADGTYLKELWNYPAKLSLGGMYLWITRFLGYEQFDEYKVMGLAALGKASDLRNELSISRLLPLGRYEIDWTFTLRLSRLARPRRAGEPITDFHTALAAAAQDALEETALHVLRYARTKTASRRLCLAGGVAHNCALNGKIAATDQFEEIFVHPASHDAGCALGAALAAEAALHGKRTRGPLRSVYWGTNLTEDEIQLTLSLWEPWVTARRVDDVPAWTALRLAEGQIIGWLQGRAEFGPRALGHRSLFADPRPLDNRDRINRIIKKREAFRPFAPVVQAEHASRFFDIPACADCSFMSFAVQLKDPWQDKLRAITHSDGTARLQTVTRGQNRDLWILLDHFAKQTGVCILLNTSLNVSGEPIVDNTEDAIVFLLTTTVDAVVIGNFVVERKKTLALDALAPSLPGGVRLSQQPAEPDGARNWLLEQGPPSRASFPISMAAVHLLLDSVGDYPLKTAAAALSDSEREAVATELGTLWQRRLVRFAPPRCTA